MNRHVFISKLMEKCEGLLALLEVKKVPEKCNIAKKLGSNGIMTYYKNVFVIKVMAIESFYDTLSEDARKDITNETLKSLLDVFRRNEIGFYATLERFVSMNNILCIRFVCYSKSKIS